MRQARRFGGAAEHIGHRRRDVGRDRHRGVGSASAQASAEGGGVVASDQPGAIVSEFTHQADAFARAAVYQLAATLDALLDSVPLSPNQRWLDVACGPGIVTRALAGRVGEAVGVDITPAMLEKARADAAGIANARFVLGDATALPFPDGGFDGALTRFSLHHIPAPARVLREMARVVVTGGYMAAADHLTSSETSAAAWHHDIERLRDPSHWLSLSPEVFFGLGEPLGLRLVTRQVVPFDLDFEEWLTRGSGGAANRGVIEALLAAPPAGSAEVFAVSGGRLHVSLGLAVWQRVSRP